jgi:hypothetical protein
MPAERTAKVIDERYLIADKLGEGGMGVVHKAWDRVAKRELALKSLNARYARVDGVVELFEREFHTLKNLAHPNVVEVYDYGIADAPYYTMELLSGTTADQLAPMAWQQTCNLLREVASALALIHSRRLVHRDVTWRNIHIAADGTVKLIDFGSLMPMGVPRDCVGTPAFMAPEVVQRLALDQRADLYSLGATAYHLLVASSPYPARDIADLHDAWGTRPAKPSALVPEIPPDLDELVMSLLSLQVAARPIDVSVVIARLTAIAGLPQAPTEKAARSFLITPALVGRERELQRAREALARAQAGHGGCTLLRAEPRLGRSRLLDAIALDAQLAGALVLRADARDGASVEALRAALSVDTSNFGPSLTAKDDALLLQALRGLLSTRCAVILIDDVHQFCPPALVLLRRLATLAHNQRCLIVFTHALPLPEDVEGSIKLLVEGAQTLELAPLSAQHTTELLAACFDRAQNLHVIAELCHAVSSGRPGVCLALAQHLVDMGIAVYAGGAWSLPDSLAEYSLPATAEQLIAGRIARLDVDQRAWAQLLALIHPAARITTAECVRIMEAQMSRARSHAALDGLVAEQLAISDGSVTQIASSLRPVLLATLSPQLTRQLHQRVAQYLEARADDSGVVAAIYHGAQAGDYEQALRCTDRVLAMSELHHEGIDKRLIVFGEWCSSLNLALDELSRAGRPLHELYTLYRGMMSNVAVSEPGSLWRCAPYFEHLKRDTGLDYWSDAEIDALLAGQPISKPKLLLRLLRASLRHRFTPKRQRGADPKAALALLANYVTTALAAHNVMQNLQTGGPPLYRALAPFRSLSPALDLIFELVSGATEATRGLEAGWQRLLKVRQRLQQPVPGMPESFRGPAHDLVSYMEAMARLAPAADPRALEVARQLEAFSPFGAQAEQLRMVYYQYKGDAENAAKHSRELEALAITSSRDNLNLLAGKRDVAQAQAICGDTLGLRHSVDVLEATAKRFPGWRGQLLLFRAEYARLLGDLVGAREHFEEVLAFAPAGEYFIWAKAAGPYVEVLLRLGHTDEAVGFAEHALAEDERLGFTHMYRVQIEIAAALAWSAQGQHARASAVLDAILASETAQGLRGASLALLEHARARVALAAGDTATFERATQDMGHVVANHNSPTLVTRYTQLLADGQQHRNGAAPAAPAEVELDIQARIDHATSQGRFQRALELLIQRCDAESGHLFVVEDSSIQCVASTGDAAATATAAEFAQSVLDRSEHAVKDSDLDDDVTCWLRWTTDAGAVYEPVLLDERDGTATAPLAIAILRQRTSALHAPSIAFVRGLVRALRFAGDLPHPSARAAV